MKEAKEKWLKAIKENKGEITPFTEYKFGGIYMLYIDNFEDKHIIPIYIGKTNHFQKRHKEHFRKLLELNKKNYNDYCNYIRSFEIEKRNKSRNKSNDNGNYRYCKIFKYLIDHNLTLDNLHMIILKNEDNSQELERLESKYINYFQSDIYGFNTLNSLSNQFKYKNDEENPDFLDLINQDIDKCLKYQNCGYTTFNTWNFYRRFVAQNVEVKEKITPLIMENLNYYDDNGVRMFDEKGSFEEYFKNLVLKSNQLNFELLQIKEKLKLKIAELIKGKYVERNTEKCINFIIVKIFYKIITSLGYKHKFTLDFISYNMVEYNYNSDETDDKVHQGALKIMREIDFIKIFKDDLVKWKKDFEEFVENDRKIKCFPYKYFDLITNESLDEEVREFYKKELYYGNFIDLINRSSRIPHPSKTIFRYILPSKEFKENIISKKYISPLNYINTYKNDNDVSMICIFNDETKMDEYYGGINFIYIGICYKDIQSEIMFRPDFDINTDVEYYTTISSSNIIPEEDSAKFYEKLEQILEMVRNNIKIFIDVYYISSNLKTATEIITNTFKEYGFINFERVRIKKIIK